MSIFRVHKNKTHPYTVIDNTSVNDKRLSAKSKGLLLFLISKPDHWFINFKNLTSSFTDGERSIRSGINELIKFGYIVRHHIRNDNGQFTSYDYSVYEQPIKNSISATYSPPDCRNAVLDNAFLDNAVLLSTDKKENTKNNNNSTVGDSITPKLSVDVFHSSKQKADTINLLKKLKIVNHNKLFDLFLISDIFDYANWINQSNFKMKNPTGFLITAIRQKWMDVELFDNPKGLRIFFQECSLCRSHFAYEEYEPKYTECRKCRKDN